MRVILAQPRGFCAGVERAIEIVERALKVYGPPVYVRHEIVHNKRVVEDLKAKGAVFVEEVDEVPAGAITIFSAHGVSQRVEDDAHDRELPVIDATCPLVAKVHKEGERYAKNGYEVILIGPSKQRLIGLPRHVTVSSFGEREHDICPVGWELSDNARYPAFDKLMPALRKHTRLRENSFQATQVGRRFEIPFRVGANDPVSGKITTRTDEALELSIEVRGGSR